MVPLILGALLAGDMSVLRVLIAYPALPHEKTIVDVVNADKLNHPAAFVDVKTISKDRQLLFTVEGLEKTLHSTLNRFTLKRGIDEAYETGVPRR